MPTLLTALAEAEAPVTKNARRPRTYIIRLSWIYKTKNARNIGFPISFIYMYDRRFIER